jgi:hypothetical protein
MNTISRTKINWWEGMKSILALLTAFVLFGLTFSSCKACDKRDDNTNNTPLDTSNSTVLSKVGKYLKNKGCDDLEIKAMMDIEKEDFGENIDRVMHKGIHFWYENHDKGGTHMNCGLYAMKRLLFVLGKHGLVKEDLWYRYTDVELRDMLVNISGYEKDRKQSETIWINILKTLMRDVGVPEEYCKIDHDFGDDVGVLATSWRFTPYSLAPGCFEDTRDRMKERMIGFEVKARAAANDAKSARVNAEEEAAKSNMAQAARWADKANEALKAANEASTDAHNESESWQNTAIQADAEAAAIETYNQMEAASISKVAADEVAKIQRIYSPDGIELPRT